MKSIPHSLKKYEYYEKSVQSPEVDVAWFESIYKKQRKQEPLTLREDFCGTFRVAIEWVKKNPKRASMGLDLDPEPIGYGRKHHLSQVTPEARKRIRIVQQNVLKPTREKFDIIVAGNFSFYIFDRREVLREYFRAVLRSLDRGGMLILEMSGGPGMLEETQEYKPIFGTVNGKRKRLFSYVWDQKSFDPIKNFARYAIHFKFPDGRWMKDAFTYDWRLWSIPEVREIMSEAGFSKSVVYWETEHKGEGTGEYVAMESGDNAFSWISYLVGLK